MHSTSRSLAATIVFLAATSAVFGQGSLTPPPGPPAPTMKTLQNLWDKLGTMDLQLDAHSGQLDALQEEHQDITTLINSLKSQTTSLQSQTTALQEQATTLQTENAALKAQNEALTNLMISMGSAAGTLPWSPSNVDTTSGTFSLISTAAGPNGKQAIAYLKNGALRVAHYSGTSWAIYVIPVADTVTCLSVHYTPQGWPGVAFGTAANMVKYADYNGSSWTIYNVDTPGAEIRGCSLAMTPAGRPAIAYGVYPVTLKLTVAGDLGWTPSVVYSSFSSVLSEVDLAYNSVGRPCIVCHSNSDYKYFSFNGSTWSMEILEHFGNMDVSFGFSPAGIPTIAYTGSGSLFFYERLSSGWQRTNLDGNAVVAGYDVEGCSLAWTPGGRPAIAYHGLNYVSGNPQNVKLRYAVHNGTGWTLSVVGTEQGIGTRAGLSFDVQGQPVISYTAANATLLRVTRRTPFAQP